MIELDIWGRLIEMDEINLFWWDGYCLLSLWADALHGSTRLIFFLQYIHSYIYNK